MKAHQLEEKMRLLKLFGMLETLPVRLAQATAGELGHVELLEVLLEDKAARRDVAGLERRIKAARFEQRLRRWARPHLLIFDDFAMRDFTLAQADDLYELVTERSGKASIFTANRKADWYSLFSNPVVAESILDRVVNAAHHVAMEGKSYRPMKRPGTPGAGK